MNKKGVRENKKTLKDGSYYSCPGASCTIILLHVTYTASMCWPSMKWKITTGLSATSNPFVNTDLAPFPCMLGHRVRPKICTQNWDTAGLFEAGSQLLLLHWKELFFRRRIVNVCQCLTSGTAETWGYPEPKKWLYLQVNCCPGICGGLTDGAQHTHAVTFCWLQVLNYRHYFSMPDTFQT